MPLLHFGFIFVTLSQSGGFLILVATSFIDFYSLPFSTISGGLQTWLLEDLQKV
jgi:hypothetical protein